MASSPTRLASCLSQSLNLVCKILISLLGLSETNTIGYYISPEGQKAVAKAAAFVTRPRPDVPFTAVSAVGTTAHIAERIHQYVDAGAAKFVVRPLCAGEEAMAQLAMLGQEIVPLFHPPAMRTTDRAWRP